MGWWKAYLSVLAAATIHTLLRRIVTFFVPALPGGRVRAVRVLYTGPPRAGAVPDEETACMPTPFSRAALALAAFNQLATMRQLLMSARAPV
jgi:hypothetical protein